MSDNQDPKGPVFYVRLSSLDQNDVGSIEDQRHALTAVAADRGLDIHQEYVEQAPSDDDTPTQEA